MSRTPPPAREKSEFVALRLLTLGALLGFAVVGARLLTPTERAEYALPLALATAAWALCHLSIDNACGRLIGRGEATIEELAGGASALSIALSSVAVTAAAAVALAAPGLIGDPSPALLLLALAAIPALQLGGLAAELLLIIGALRGFSRINLVAALAQLACLVGAAFATDVTPTVVMACGLVGFGVNAVLLAAAVGLALGWSYLVPRTGGHLPRQLAAVGVRLHTGTVSQQLGPRLTLLVSGAIIPAASLGIYSLAATLAEALQGGVRAVAQTAIHQQTMSTTQGARDYTGRFLRQSFHLALIMAVVAWAISYPLIAIVFGPQWSSAVVPFCILSVAAASLAVAAPAQTLLVRQGRVEILSLVAAGSLGLGIAAIVVAAPSHGAVVVAACSTGASLLYASTIMLLLRRVTGIELRTVFARPEPGDLLSRLIVGIRDSLLAGRPSRKRGLRHGDRG